MGSKAWCEKRIKNGLILIGCIVLFLISCLIATTSDSKKGEQIPVVKVDNEVSTNEYIYPSTRVAEQNPEFEACSAELAKQYTGIDTTYGPLNMLEDNYRYYIIELSSGTYILNTCFTYNDVPYIWCRAFSDSDEFINLTDSVIDKSTEEIENINDEEIYTYTTDYGCNVLGWKSNNEKVVNNLYGGYSKEQDLETLKQLINSIPE